MEMGSQHFGHIHPLVSNEEQSNQIKEANCSRCGKMVSGSSFGCAECGFYLHKKCAEAPSEIDHPFHRKHPFVLLPKPPCEGKCTCNFCGKTCKMFIYHCSCGLDLHIKCGLFSLNIAEKKLEELKLISTKVPLISTEDANKELESVKCFGCREPLFGSLHFSLDCGFNLHKRCAELPHEINHPFHKKHPLILQFNAEHFSCKICKRKPSTRGFIYSCSPCKFALHVKCAELPSQISLPSHRKHLLNLQQNNSENLSCMICQETKPKKPIYLCSPCKFALHVVCVSLASHVKDKNHQHQYTVFWRQVSLICDACGSGGNYVPYICTTCNLLVHKKCISLPLVIKIPRHEHPVFHNYFLPEHEFKNFDCKLCYEEVKIEYGSYSCSNCKFIVHVNCATEKKGWYHVIEAKDKDEKLVDDLALVPSMSINPITCVIEKNEGGEMTKIKHFSHAHDLILRGSLMEEYCDGDSLMKEYCDGCVLPISIPFYSCSQCDFLLHKTCAELPKKKQLWFHICQRFLILVVGYIFKCDFCQSECNGFSYRCNECDIHYCLQCAASDFTIRHQGHKHLLLYDRNREGSCNSCGVKRRGLFKCKQCSFFLHIQCLRLPLTAWHKCDEHPLALTCHEGNEYSEYQYCDICEEKRRPDYWFYHCATCETSAHPQCALGWYPFIKPGSIHKVEDHSHPLTFVRKTFYYPGCHKCGKPCQDLALECAECAYNYVVHWKCVKPPHLSSRPLACKTDTDYEIDKITTDHETDTSTGSACGVLFLILTVKIDRHILFITTDNSSVSIDSKYTYGTLITDGRDIKFSDKKSTFVGISSKDTPKTVISWWKIKLLRRISKLFLLFNFSFVLVSLMLMIRFNSGVKKKKKKKKKKNCNAKLSCNYFWCLL